MLDYTPLGSSRSWEDMPLSLLASQSSSPFSSLLTLECRLHRIQACFLPETNTQFCKQISTHLELCHSKFVLSEWWWWWLYWVSLKIWSSKVCSLCMSNTLSSAYGNKNKISVAICIADISRAYISRLIFMASV